MMARGRAPRWLPRWAREADPGRWFVIAMPYLWLAIFFLVPFFIVLKISLSTVAPALPPVAPILTWTADKVLQLQLHLSNFAFILSDDLYVAAFLHSLEVAAVSTLMALLIGYPMA